MSNGDNNFVLYNTGQANQSAYFMPNGIWDIGRQPVHGREQQPIRGADDAAARRGAGARPSRSRAASCWPNGTYVNAVSPNYHNPIRAGYSMDVSDLVNGSPRDAADDNFNSFDPWSPGPHWARSGTWISTTRRERFICRSIGYGAG